MPALRKLAVVAVLAASFAVVSPAPAEPPHGWDVHCGRSINENGAGWWNLKGYNVACAVARKTANRHVFRNDPAPKGWHCRDVQIGDEVWRTNCKRQKDGEHQHIRFKFGA
jgi:hypothetical protein